MKSSFKNSIFAIFTLILVISLSFSTQSFANTDVSENDEDKGETSEFYLKIRGELQKYLRELEDEIITEEEFEQKVKENITPQLQTEKDEDMLIESESKSKEIQPLGLDKFYDFGAFGYKATEIALFAKHPIKASKAKKLAEQALDSAKYRYKDYTLWQGNGDAYRHAFWSALMTVHIDRDFAYEAGYAHEGYKPGASIKSLDVKMDILNNYSGRKDGTYGEGKKYSDKQLAEYILDTVSAGKKVRIRTYTSGKADDYLDGVPTKYTGKYVPTTDGGRVH
ncbi:DUF6973 domain-containing protein [Heyndrickxia sp. FSL W8-0423]|uniref:DUF6973 domain-containing protein n=2 Tax=Heyndrickxia TaxID=2837504 RepID=UPI0030F5FBA0